MPAFTSGRAWSRRTIPGLALAVLVAAAATGLSRLAPPTLGPVLIAVIGDVVDVGGPAVGVVALTMTVAFLSVAVASRLAGIPPRPATLIGVGAAVCGNSVAMKAFRTSLTTVATSSTSSEKAAPAATT